MIQNTYKERFFNNWVIKMKVYLCKEKGCCPSVEIGENEVRIGEEGNYCTLSKEEFNSLKEKIKKGEI
jgi:hypothetical protein